MPVLEKTVVGMKMEVHPAAVEIPKDPEPNPDQDQRDQVLRERTEVLGDRHTE
jgi:hypothetical protein